MFDKKIITCKYWEVFTNSEKELQFVYFNEVKTYGMIRKDFSIKLEMENVPNYIIQKTIKKLQNETTNI